MVVKENMKKNVMMNDENENKLIELFGELVKTITKLTKRVEKLEKINKDYKRKVRKN